MAMGVRNVAVLPLRIDPVRDVDRVAVGHAT